MARAHRKSEQTYGEIGHPGMFRPSGDRALVFERSQLPDLPMEG